MNHYTLLESRPMPAYKATGHVYRHDETGARVVYIEAPEDNNKVFGIAFKTLPDNDCGIPHILEHCVLNGSRKYPVKEPFVDLLKGSLNTFLNAMTFPDKTVYPISSRNEQDFMNLMDVYLDAVFYPNVKKNIYLFRQEGWHYELNSPDEEIIYKGVVYNEMKGALSNPEGVLDDLASRHLFPNSTYGKNSGGDPEAIPSLTYEEFCAFHDKFYHPSNSYIFFYGDGDMEKHLNYLHDEYLHDFANVPAPEPAEIELEKPFEALSYAKGSYGVTEDEDLNDKTYLSYNVVLKPVKSALDYYGWGFLEALLASEASPLKRNLIKQGIGKEVEVGLSLAKLQPTLGIITKNTNEDQRQAFLSCVRESLQEIVKNGFDPKLVEAVLNSQEFQLREGDYGGLSKGLVLGMNLLELWLYGGNALELAFYEEPIRIIRNTKGYFEGLVQEILDNPHTLVATLVPERGLNRRLEEKDRKVLDELKASMSEEEILKLVEETKELTRRQMAPDAPEDSAKIPLLTLDQIGDIHLPGEAKEEALQGACLRSYVANTNQIFYLGMNFNTDYVPEEDLPYLGLLQYVLSSMDTERYTYTELDNEIGARLGGLSTAFRMIGRKDGSFLPYFTLSMKALEKEMESGLALAREILLTTKFRDLSRLKEVISESRIRLEQRISYGGDRVARGRCMSYFDEAAAYNEKVTGVDFYLFLKELEDHFDERASETAAHLEALVKMLFAASNLTIHLTSDQDSLQAQKEKLGEFVRRLPDEQEGQSESAVRVKPVMKNEALITSGKVQFVCRSGCFEEPYSGAMAVMSQVLRLEYLWNRVRAQGGAYGCRQTIDRQGRMSMVSYRDPNLEKTLEVFQEAGDFMAAFDCSDRDMTKYIIGTISSMDPVLTASSEGAMAMDMLASGYTAEDYRKTAREVLATTQGEVREAAKAVKEAMQEPFVCVQGSEAKILENQDKFDQMIHLF